MKRDFSELEQGPFDLLVIGGGIYGAWTAAHAAAAGLTVAVVDKGDWASGTSSASSKLIHGGLRYLAQYRFGLVRTSAREREYLKVLMPHRVRPLSFVAPIYHDNPVGPFLFGAGLSIYDLLAGSRSPRHRRLSEKDLRRRFAFLQPANREGAYVYPDAVTDDFRYCLDVIRRARAAGAVAVNYARADAVLLHRNRVVGAGLTDTESGRTLEVRARVVVNAAGPWAGRLSGNSPTIPLRLTRGVHLVLPALPTDHACLFMRKGDRRVIFMIPWFGRTLLGTTDTDFRGDPDGVAPEGADIDYLLAEGATRLGQPWLRRDILAAFAGVRALPDEPGKSPSQLSREWVCHDDGKGLISSLGGKLTSARADTLALLAAISKRVKADGFRLKKSPIPNDKAGDPDASPADRPAATARFGPEATALAALIKARPELGGRLHPELPFLEAEIPYCAAHEMTVHLDDLLRRRVPISILARPDHGVCLRAAELTGAELGWTEARRKDEIQRVLRIWQTPWARS